MRLFQKPIAQPQSSVEGISRLVRLWILEMTTRAGSGHPTSSLSAVELMTVLFSRGLFRYDIDRPDLSFNDRLIFSKGHASPLFYALWAVARGINPEELLTYRQFGSRLEGHPTRAFPFTEVPTGSLGQGLGVGVGMAISAKFLDHTDNHVVVLMGDGEIAEGSVWEAAQIAAYYQLSSLIAIVDASRLGQSGQTMEGRNIYAYAARFEAFGWRVVTVEDGHNPTEVEQAYLFALDKKNCSQPTVIIASTVKGKGVPFLEDAKDWHGKALDREQFDQAVREIGTVDPSLRIVLANPVVKKQQISSTQVTLSFSPHVFTRGEMASVRKVYGTTIAFLAAQSPHVVMLDAEVGNSTFALDFKKYFPDRFFQMFIAEQNMVSVATALARRGKSVYMSTFGAFLTRAFDQLRMAQYAEIPLVIVGSHPGVAIGADGASQMALEDIAMMRTLHKSCVFYPSDAVSMQAILRETINTKTLTYIRATRGDVPVLYDANETFPRGGSKVLRRTDSDQVTMVAAGVTLHEALRASDALKQEKIFARVVDLYSIKPIDRPTLIECAKETSNIIVVEDHYPEGGIADAVREALSLERVRVHSLAVRKTPRSGSSQELLSYEGIDSISLQAMIRELAKI